MDVSAIFYLVNSISFSLSYIDDVQIFIRSLSTLSRNPCTFLTLYFSLFLFPFFFFISFFLILVLVIDVESFFFIVFFFTIDFLLIV